MKKLAPAPSGESHSDDAAPFRAAVGGVNPLAQQNRIEPQPQRCRPQPQQPAAATEIPDTLSDHLTGEPPEEYLANGLSRMTLRKLRRAVWPIQDSLDLHGCQSDTARRLLQEFLHEAKRRGLRCVLVIHGKGINSEGGTAVLRGLARHWLAQHHSVLAYCNALPRDGGSGAVLVLLKIAT